MKLSQKTVNRITACIHMLLCGMMAVWAFEREIRTGIKINKKIQKKRLKKMHRKE